MKKAYDNDEDHAPPNWGGKRPGSGRPPVNLRMLDISNIGIEFDEPVTYTADITIEKCGQCGRMGWEAFTVTVKAAEKRSEPDINGDFFPILASVEMAGQLLRHKKNCSKG